jgi:hypothetical protein
LAEYEAPSTAPVAPMTRPTGATLTMEAARFGAVLIRVPRNEVL